ncbi:GNAT family N-acetyltransferase [Marinomonas sp. 15G1-11]|uniref:GNAT family N-acetyltransferase n=1 Tax=Marinomonas phaeophyticola TaxID=3004091 RepID=A0ABT4JX42_9GAMM|nr:GNAT family N-acetyltransferase [Marinomonas sp. 15G1-11]MCZ2722950.1 GNAT family N-acetyltransferase [Marinomonas sp. 15G1-11]
MFTLVELTVEDVLPIRQRVLWPQKPMSFSEVKGDASARHYGVMKQESLICVGSFYQEGTTVRLRKFATLPAYQGQGAGRFMLESIMPLLRQSGATHFWCDARESAKAFYQKFGLTPEGDRFYKSDIPYYKMVTRLS